MTLATKNEILVANWRPKNGIGDQNQISSSRLANKKFSQRRALTYTDDIFASFGDSWPIAW